MKKTALMLLFISATIFATAEVVHPFLYADTPYSPVHYVCDSPLNMRSSPGRDGQIIKQLSLGETVTLLEAGESETIDGITAWWYRALAEDKTEGWVFGGFLASQTLLLDLNTNGISDYVFFRVHSRDKQYFFDPERDLIIYIDGRRISANMISSYIEQPSHINFFMNRTRDTVVLVLYNEYTPADQEWRDPVEYHLFKLDAHGLSFITSSIDMTGTIKPAIEAELGPGMFGLNHLVTYVSQGSYGHVQEKHITAMPFRQMKTVPGGLVRQTLSITGHKTERMFNWIKPYRIGVNEVTWDLWFQVMTQSEKLGYKFSGEETPGSLEKSASGIPDEQTADYPVGNISWLEAIVWCNAYSELTGLTPVYRYASGEVKRNGTDSNGYADLTVLWDADGYRLPTDGEWQLASAWRGLFRRTPSNWASGAHGPYTVEAHTQRVAWYQEWFIEDPWSNRTQPVGRLSSNSLGLYDMSGNVSEYCYDRGAELPGFFRFNYRGFEEDYDFSAQFRLLRGGNIHSTGEEVTIGAIDSISVTNKGLNVGFRVAQSTGWHPLFFVPPVVLLLLLAGLIALVAVVVSRLTRRTPGQPPAQA